MALLVFGFLSVLLVDFWIKVLTLLSSAFNKTESNFKHIYQPKNHTSRASRPKKVLKATDNLGNYNCIKDVIFAFSDGLERNRIPWRILQSWNWPNWPNWGNFSDPKKIRSLLISRISRSRNWITKRRSRNWITKRWLTYFRHVTTKIHVRQKGNPYHFKRK